MLGDVAPIGTAMSTPGNAVARRGRAAVTVAALAAACAVLGGCGTPAVIKPSSTPLPGLERDIHSAKNVVAQAEQEAQSDSSTNPGSP